MSLLKEKIMSIVQDDLDEIEKALEENLSPYFNLVSEVASHIIFSGGKRLRPLLFVLSARICDYPDKKAVRLSSIFEYLHAATLLHDDIVDGASLRRGKEVANSIWGIPISVLVGDFLLARSSSLAAETGYLETTKELARISENMSQGEIYQLMRKGDVNISEEEYLEVIGRKTAVLFQGACRVGAIIAEAPEQKLSALSDYGFHLGVAFQMVDDLIDYTSDTATLGKEIGADLKEGKLTLPVIHALEVAEDQDRLEIESLIAKKDFSHQEFDALVKKLKKYDGIAYTKNQAAAYVAKSKEALAAFASSETKETLMMIADYVLERNA
jgi:octaprenyl-diphosphate synthase